MSDNEDAAGWPACNLITVHAAWSHDQGDPHLTPCKQLPDGLPSVVSGAALLPEAAISSGHAVILCAELVTACVLFYSRCCISSRYYSVGF